MKNKVEIKRNVKIEDIEKLIQSPNENEWQYISLPTRLERSGLPFIEMSLCQFLITRANFGIRSGVMTHIDKNKNEEEYIESFLRNTTGLIASHLSGNLLRKDKSEIEKNKVKEIESKIWKNDKNLFIPTLSKGPFALILGSYMEESKKFPLQFYLEKRRGSVRKLTDFHSEIKNIMKPNSFSSSEFDLGSLANIVYELFVNTDQHGMTDISGNEIPHGVRGLFTKVHNVAGVTGKFTGQDEKLSKYFSDLKRRGKVLEVTVFDSGIGMPSRWTGKEPENMTIPEQKNSVINCFEKHGTTKWSEFAGSGLTNVLESLKNCGGVIRVRTGKTCFMKIYSEPGVGSAQLNEGDWIPNRNLGLASGTFVSILLQRKK